MLSIASAMSHGHPSQHPCTVNHAMYHCATEQQQSAGYAVLTACNGDVAQKCRRQARTRLCSTRQAQGLSCGTVFPSWALRLWAVLSRAPTATGTGRSRLKLQQAQQKWLRHSYVPTQMHSLPLRLHHLTPISCDATWFPCHTDKET